jgi:flagellar biosynthetic protein FliO
MKRVLIFTCVFMFALPIACLAQAADSSAATFASEMEFGSIWGMGLRLFLTLAIVVLLIIGSVWLYRRVMTRRWPGSVTERPVRLIDRVHIAPKRSLDVVAIGERVILLGTTETQISYLTELTPEEKAKLESPADGSRRSFASSLFNARKRAEQPNALRSEMTADADLATKDTRPPVQFPTMAKAFSNFWQQLRPKKSSHDWSHTLTDAREQLKTVFDQARAEMPEAAIPRRSNAS